jgi:hypothetical protein
VTELYKRAAALSSIHVVCTVCCVCTPHSTDEPTDCAPLPSFFSFSLLSERSKRVASRFAQEVERKRQEQLERMKYDAISAGSEADRGTESCEACHWHGMCTFDGNCICASLWSGKFCEVDTTPPLP